MGSSEAGSDFYVKVSAQKYGEDGWRAFLTYFEDGKRRQATAKLETKGRTKAAKKAAENEADEVRKRMNAEHVAGAKARARRGATVSDYLGRLIESRAASKSIEKSTASEYRRIHDNLLGAEFGGMELSKVTPDDVQDWVNGLAKEYAPTTVRKALVLVRSMFTQAVERDVIAKNPTRTVRAPSAKQSRPNAFDERGRAKVAGFIALDPTDPLNIGYALALYLGMREGEICGLQWRYVDLDAGTLSIEKTIGHRKDGKGANEDYLKAPKTGGSRRTIPIPADLLAALGARRAVCREASMRMGTKFADTFVIGREDGTPMPTHYLSTKWRKVAEVLDLVGIEGTRPRFHDLRHTFATKAIADGVDVKTVSSILGHANAAMTLNIYASADPKAKRDGVNAVADAIAKEAKRHAADGEVIRLRPTGTDD